MNDFTHLNRRERREYFWYLLIIVLIVSAFLTWLLLHGSGNPFNMVSDADRDVLRQNAVYEGKQKKALALYDTAMQKISQYKVNSSSVLEAEIQSDIKSLKALYDKKEESDTRTMSFETMATFLEMHLTDVMNLRRGIDNYALYRDQVDKCRMGIEKTEQRIRAANPTGR